jgi:hypothetical protein
MYVLPKNEIAFAIPTGIVAPKIIVDIKAINMVIIKIGTTNFHVPNADNTCHPLSET